MNPYRAPAVSSLVFTSFKDELHALDRATGAPVWHHEGSGWPNMRIAVRDDRIFLLGANLVCLDTATGREIWRRDKGDGWVLLVDRESVFVGGGGQLSCFAAETGQLQWQQVFKGKGGTATTLSVVGQVVQADLT